MLKTYFWTLTFALLAFFVVVQIPANDSVYSQGRGNATSEVNAKRNGIESELKNVGATGLSSLPRR
jgi:hypothetical protein